MKSSYIIGLLIGLIILSCTNRTSKSNSQILQSPTLHLNWNGVQVNNGPGRGLSFLDSLGIEYGHGHIRSTITNDSSVLMNLQIDLSQEYHFPAPYSDQKFKVILWPQKLTIDNVISPDSISDELRSFLAYETDNNDTLNISIEPKEKYVITFGTLQQYPTNCFISPNMLFVQNKVAVFPKCDNLVKHDQETNPSIVLRLRVDFSDVGCSIIPLGKISFDKH